MSTPARAPEPVTRVTPPISTARTTTPPRWRVGTFRALRHRNYRLYFVGQLVSLTGSWMQITALMWLAYELTKGSRWPSFIGAAQLLPALVLGAWGGSLADRFTKRSIIFVAQSGLLVSAVVLAGLVVTGRATPWNLLAVAIANGVISAIDLPARLAFVIDMTGKEDLVNAVALNSLMFNAARAVGPMIGGITLKFFGPAVCFLLNALSFVAVLAALALMDVDGRPAGSHARRPSLRAGFRYLAEHRGLLLLFLLGVPMALFGWPTMTLLPALADRHLGAGGDVYASLTSAVGSGAQFGWPAVAVLPAGLERHVGAGRGVYASLLSTVGCGALVAALLVATFGSVGRRKYFLGAGVCLTVVALAGLTRAADFRVAASCCTLLGTGLILFFPTAQAIMQLGATDENRGLIMGIWTMLTGAVPVGTLLAGPAADLWGVPGVLAAESAGIALAGAGVVAASLWRGRSVAAGERG